MATIQDVLTYARNLCQTDSIGLSDSVGLTFVNDAYENFTRELLKRDIDASQIQEAYTDLTANQGSYAWPTDMFALKTIEVNYTDTSKQNYLQVEQMDIANLSGNTSFDYLRVNQPTQNPIFDNHGDTFELFPTPTGMITGGIRIFYYLIPTEFTATTDAIPYPVSLDYRALACRVAALNAKRQEKPDIADIFDKEYQDRVQDIIRILAPGSQQPVKVQTNSYPSGWEF